MLSPSTSALYVNQQHLLHERSFNSLSSLSATSQCTLVRHPPIEVDHFTNCPNIHCTVHVPHTYYHDVVKPCPNGIPILFLWHFHPNLNPFPNNTQYEVMEAPSVLLEHGHQAYIMGYGVVRLLEITVEITKRSKEWKVFQCIKGGEIVVAEIAAKKEWCKIPERHMGFCGVSFSFLHFFWPTLLITPFLVDSRFTPITSFAGIASSLYCVPDSPLSSYYLALSVFSLLFRGSLSVSRRGSVENIVVVAHYGLQPP